MSSTVSIKLVRSAINRPERQKLTLQALGLKRLNQSVQHNLTPQIEGMISKISHLVVVEKIS